MTIDHVVPSSRGGSDSLNNMVLACNACNCTKSNMDYERFLESDYLRERRISIVGEKEKHQHDAIKFSRRGNWSCLCGATGLKGEDPKAVRCTLALYGTFYRPVA